MRSKSKWLARGLFLIVFALLVATFFDSTYRWNNFENYSENLVSGRIYAEVNGFPINERYGLGRVTVEDSPCNNDYSAYYQYPDRYQETSLDQLQQAANNFSPYRSQIGLQGHIFGLAARFIRHPKIWLVFRIANISALILVVMLISNQLAKQYGRLLGTAFLGVSILSPWVRNFAPNLYWVEFTWFLPMLFGLLCITKRQKRGLWYLLFFLSVFIKCLCGFEYLSTILIGGVLFLAAEWIAEPSNRKEWSVQIGVLGTLSVLAFLIVYVITANMWNPDLPFWKGLLNFWNTNAARRLQGTDPDEIATTIPMVKVVMLYFWENLSGKAMLLTTVCGGGTLFYRRYRYEESDIRQWALYFLSLLGTLSWFVLAKQHSYIHLHLNFVLWYLGAIQIQVWIVLDAIWCHRKIF